MKKNYDRTIELICPVCGNKTFSYDSENEESDVTCLECNNIFTRKELQEANQENININLAETKKEVLKDVENDIQKMIKNIF